ncbi:hypothetical protein HRbin16_01396 [bacterium HR16]|nr:hypothetical protein HRbin16_01396 [bacterium HR16]
MTRAGETIEGRLSGVRRIFLDTAPIIYHVEGVALYQPLTDLIFSRIGEGALVAVTSCITLAECLVHPYRRGDMQLVQQFKNVITRGRNTRYVGVDSVVEQAAELRARYNLTLIDSLQIASAIADGCDSFLTNDLALKRVTGMNILVLDELLRLGNWV